MKKFILGLLGLIVVAVIAVVVIVSTQLTTIIETAGSKVLGVPVTVGSVKLDPLGGAVDVTDLRIGNPEGYTSEYAFDLTSVRAKVDLASVLSDVVVVEEILINAPKITFEGSFADNNIMDITNNVKKNTASTSTEAPAEEAAATEEAGPAKNVAIAVFELSDAQMNVIAQTPAGEQSVSQTLPTLRLTGIGTPEKGVTTQEAIDTVMTSLQQASSRVALKALDEIKGVLRNGVDTFKGRVKTLGEDVKSLFK